MENDIYRTIDVQGEGIYSEKRSKFLAFAIPVLTVEDVKCEVEAYQKKYYDARHVCYAYRLGERRELFRANDNGEPSGTAGKLIEGYTEKQWGRDCKELPAFIIKRLPVRYTYDNNYFDDLYQGIPVNGYNELIGKLLRGAEVLTGTDYNSDREKYNSLARKVLYTGTLDSFYDYKLGRLSYRSLRFETEVLDTENFQGVAVVNYTDRETPYTRIIEHKHFTFGKQEKTVITREYPLKWEEGMEAYYPVNDEKNQELFAKYKALSEQEENVIFGGRLAEYKYYDMDKVIGAALAMADEVFG